MSTEEAAQRLGISAIQVRQLIDKGRLPAKNLGSTFAIRSSDLKLVENRGGRAKR
jgi:excisionase family DNA binding protein